MLRRRRPLLRAAAVGGVAYHAGKKHAQKQQSEDEQNQRIAQLEAQQQMSEPSATPGGPPVA
jgi:hypothetical protein